MGVLHATGALGVPLNPSQAVLYYYFSALAGYFPAQLALGYRHNAGLGVPLSCPTAALYYELAANAVVEQQEAMGIEAMFTRERISPKHQKAEARSQGNVEVVDYYQHIASKGDVQASAYLGQIYYYGFRGVER